MQLAPGSRLGVYEVIAPLGTGGMGEVYKAKDARLDRYVALKVIREITDVSQVHRFVQEAQIAGGLSHPNLLAIYDIGEGGGVPYIVSELLDGESLRSRLTGSRLPTGEAIEIGAQIAQGMAAAHDRGIVHRDLKPENVFLTKDGVVKILDFGLAKAVSATRSADGRDEHTVTSLTNPGVIMGTVGYMSPEQIRGAAVDHRSDIFSLGLMLYEMFVGKRAFVRDTPVETMNAILNEDVSPTEASGARVLPGLEQILQHCLEKRPNARYQSARDLAFHLKCLGTGSSPSAAPVIPTRRRALVQRAAAALVGLGAVFIAGWSLGGRTANPAPAYTQLTYRNGYVLSAQFAPDDKTIIYGGAWEGQPLELFVSTDDGPESRPLGLGHAEILAASSKGELALKLQPGSGYDGSMIASPGRLARVSMNGGSPREVLDNVRYADWSPDGSQLAVVRWIAETSRDQLEYPIGQVLHSNAFLAFPKVSPDGNRVAVLEFPDTYNEGSLVVVDAIGRARSLWTGTFRPRGLAWTPDGEEIWFTYQNNRGATQLDAVDDRGRRRNIAEFRGWGALQDISNDGRLLMTREKVRVGLMFSKDGENERDLSWFDGSNLMDISRDGQEILLEEAAVAGGPRNRSYLRKTDGSPAVTLGEGQAWALSADKKSVVFAGAPHTRNRMMIVPTGSGITQALPPGDVESFGFAFWTPDDKRVVFTGFSATGGWRLYVQEATSVSLPVSVGPALAGWEFYLSPDGTAVVARLADGTNRRFSTLDGAVAPIPGVDDGEDILAWAADGLYVSKSRALPRAFMRVNPETGKRTPWKVLPSPVSAGLVPTVNPTIIHASLYGYSYFHLLSDLEIVTLR